MSLQLRRISLNNFRKFREPLTIEGLGEGLNIIIEPNERGKSTILEALRAAFFVRHATKNQLAQSFAPYGAAEIGRAHVCTPVTNAHLVCRLLLEKKKSQKHVNTTQQHDTTQHN